jgi:hypothetical protein
VLLKPTTDIMDIDGRISSRSQTRDSEIRYFQSGRVTKTFIGASFYPKVREVCRRSAVWFVLRIVNILEKTFLLRSFNLTVLTTLLDRGRGGGCTRSVFPRTTRHSTLVRTRKRKNAPWRTEKGLRYVCRRDYYNNYCCTIFLRTKKSTLIIKSSFSEMLFYGLQKNRSTDPFVSIYVWVLSKHQCARTFDSLVWYAFFSRQS